MADQAKPIARPSRRFLRFSVRGLIVVVLVIGVWLGLLVRSARIQREAVATIEQAGGFVRYNWEWDNGKPLTAGKPWAPRWLVDVIGADYFGHVTEVRLPVGATDAMVTPVGRLTRLQCLNLDGSSISDAGLAHLKGLTNLSVLRLAGTQVTDAGLAHLKRLTELTELYLGDTQVSDAGLAHLKGLTKLSILLLYSTQVSDVGLAHLKGLTKLSVLSVSGTHVTDAGLEHLKGLTELSDLNIQGTQVTRAGTDELKQALPDLFTY